jgi:hypothetical protein
MEHIQVQVLRIELTFPAIHLFRSHAPELDGKDGKGAN